MPGSHPRAFTHTRKFAKHALLSLHTDTPTSTNSVIAAFTQPDMLAQSIPKPHTNSSTSTTSLHDCTHPYHTTIDNRSSHIKRPKQRRRIHALTDSDRNLLLHHQGCNKCRRFYVLHNHTNCPNDFPPASPSIPLSTQLAGKVFQASQLPTYDALRGIPATSFAVNSVTPPPQFTGSNTLQTNMQYPLDESTADIGPSAFPHLTWKAAAFGLNDFPDTVECLLDIGANLNLIRPETVADLGLTARRMPKPIPVSAAFDDTSSLTPTFLEHYVSLSLSSQNNRWTSLTLRAITAPNLCSSIILGTPFLSRNKIVIDTARRTAIQRDTGFDLLNEDALPLPPPPKPHRLERRKQFKQQWKACLAELKDVCNIRRKRLESEKAFETIRPFNYIAAIKTTIENLAHEDANNKLAEEIMDEFSDLFKPIPHADLLPTDVLAHIPLKDKYKPLKTRKYSVPRALRPKFKELIDLRLSQGFIQTSSSHFASPSFVVPKSDPTALPRWVCDYRQLNENTIPDKYQMPNIEDILADCGKGKIWCTIDMTDSFYQTRMHPKDIHKTAVSTPFGTYEWRVMPQGFRNSPAIHQRRVENALREHNGKICRIYLDDCCMWATDVADAASKIRKIFSSLRKAGLYINKKKIKMFSTSVKFLGHIISQAGIEADGSKIERILKWPTPKNGKEVRQFLGLVRYIGAFLPRLAHHTEILNKLTTKSSLKHFPPWTSEHQFVFESIKQIIVSRECLTVINHATLHENKIFVTTDASDTVTGAVLSFGQTWETARPVAFDSKTMKDAELNYPVHEKELLAIMRALRKWRTDLLGSPFYVYTDHKTLLNFNTQKDLSRRQARWMEELASFDCKFVYIKGEHNTVADALSRYPFQNTTSSHEAELHAQQPFTSTSSIEQALLNIPSSTTRAITAALIATQPPAQPTQTATSSLQINKEIIKNLKQAYDADPWCTQLKSAAKGMKALTLRDGLWFLNDRLIIPADSGLREQIFRLAHDSLGHFGFYKTYKSIQAAQKSYFWPGM